MAPPNSSPNPTKNSSPPTIQIEKPSKLINKTSEEYYSPLPSSNPVPIPQENPLPLPIPQPVPKKPNPQPDNNWGEILKEIHAFLVSKPTRLAEVKAFAEKYPDPLAGIDLKGISAKELTKRGTTPVSGLENMPSLDGDRVNMRRRGEPWKHYQALSATGNGNCFFNAFSILLVGDESLAMRLRVAACLNIMKNPKIVYKGDTAILDDEQALLNMINFELISQNFAVDGGWVYSSFSPLLNILRRPLAYIGAPCTVYYNKAYNDYPEMFVIYNGSNHFQPLIIPQYS